MSDAPTYEQLSALCVQLAAALVKCRVAGLSTDGPYDARREASDAIDNALTAYRTLSPDPVWQPIGTAPRRADRILVAYPDSWNGWRVCEAWWAIPYEAAPDERGWWQTMNGVLLSSDVHVSPSGKRLGATHWMPLPEPPQVESNRARGEG